MTEYWKSINSSKSYFTATESSNNSTADISDGVCWCYATHFEDDLQVSRNLNGIICKRVDTIVNVARELKTE